MMLLATTSIHAQRFMDNLDRGLVAMKTGSNIYLSWRLFGDEYYDVAFNVYRDGTLVNATPLSVSNYLDASGTSKSTYTVVPVVRGVEQKSSASAAASVWSSNYLEIAKPKRTSVVDGSDITDSFQPNDATIADVDGDGQMELLVKEICTIDKPTQYPNDGGNYDRIEVFKLDGTLLWWIDCGPNLCDFQHNETNIAAYDWDMDGKAECIIRAADGTTIHTSDGKTYVIGDATKNYRSEIVNATNEYFVHSGAEFLVYMNGATGTPYNIGPSTHPTYMDYPLKRLEDGETSLSAAWGDGYGHRSSKHFFGAPYLDGKKPSIFLGRGIYTRHKMIAYDVDPTTHALKTRWNWTCSNSSSSWYGQGYHNYSIADVDWDGRDEIIWGSMVIDDNGKGLSTTGLGHGDAHHCSDFDPYNHGQEIFACNEAHPANNFRDATTSKIYYRVTSGNDDGRCMMANVTDDYPGCVGVSARDGWMSSVTHETLGKSGGIDENFRLYWDGDLLEETFNYSGWNSSVYAETGNPRVLKCGKGSIFTFDNCKTNNGTKGTPCFTGDIFGDWREEVVLRTEDNAIRIWTTNVSTPWKNYTLLHDPQYRNGMVWEMNGYNQPPHVSYFLGKLEGITMAPPAPTTTGKTVVANGGSVTSAMNDKQVLISETGDATVSVADGSSPWVFTDNAPSWVQGNDNNNSIKYTYYTHTLTGGAFTGSTRVVKLGDGTLVMPKVTQTYTGNTDVWYGTLQFDGELKNSRLWLNRHTKLISDGGKFDKSIQADYNATVIPGGQAKIGTITTDSLILNFGSRLLLDVQSETCLDNVKANVLKIEKKNWQYGPKYLTPVIQINSLNGKIATGKYLLAEVGKIEGDISDIVLEGLSGSKGTLTYEDGKLYLNVAGLRSASSVEWTGESSNVWDFAETSNFKVGESSDIFVTGDNVTFEDGATNRNVVVSGQVSPASVVFNNTETYAISGDSICGDAPLTKNGTGKLNITNVNHFGNTTINGGSVVVSSLAYTGVDYGSLGSEKKRITLAGGELAISTTMSTTQNIHVKESGTINTGSANLTLAKALVQDEKGSQITKTGSGALTLTTGNSISKIILSAGTLNGGDGSTSDTLVFNGGTYYDSNSENSYSTNRTNFVVNSNKTGNFYMDPRCTYTGKLIGSGTLNVYAAGIRNYLQGDWSGFTGTVVPGISKRGSYTPSFVFQNTYGLPNATMNLGSSVTVSNDGKAFSVKKVTGSGTLSGTGTWTLSGDDNFSFNANTTSSTPLKKAGSGTMTLLSLGKILGSLEVSDGTLRFAQSSLKTLVAGSTFKISNQGKVIGMGLLNSLLMSGSGELSIRSYSSSSTVATIKTNLLANIGKGTKVTFVISGNNGCSSLQVGSSLTYNGSVVVELNGYTPSVGDTFTLWTSKSFSGTPTFELPELPSGLAWDTTELTGTTGVLKVVASTTGISNISSSSEVSAEVYNASGAKVADYDHVVKASVPSLIKNSGMPAGVYIVRFNDGKQRQTSKIIIR